MFENKHSTFVLSLLLFCKLQSASAGPMGFKDATMVMGDFTHNWQEAFVNYAITPRDAFGVGATYMRSDDETKTRWLEEVIYTRLLQRWNLPHAQANVWLMGGVGSLQGEDKRIGQNIQLEKTMVTPGVQFDYETTRVYFQATHRLYRASGINHDFSSVRAGFSFYETDYDKTQPWLIIEARKMHDLSDKVEVTPMLRFINKSFFVEAGVNNAHEPRFNLMYLF